jgi:hypothetical protein
VTAIEFYRGFKVEMVWDDDLPGGPYDGVECRWWASLDCSVLPPREPFPNIGVARGIARRAIDAQYEAEALGVLAGARELVRRHQEGAL